jgi:hypothetical protein
MSRKLESIDIEVNERKGTPMPYMGSYYSR